jgi:hypothetical protein
MINILPYLIFREIIMGKKVVASIKDELLCKSKEAALAAVKIFNDPGLLFKSESFVVLINIAWTYLMHAYYRTNHIEYRYYIQQGKRRKFDRTSHKAYKYWELERCLNDNTSPIDKGTSTNLRFLINLRHEIEHKMTTRIDDLLSARFQACCLNYNHYLKKLFNDKYGIEKYLSFSLQFSAINVEQKELLKSQLNLPKNILSFINTFDNNLSDDEYSSPQYAYRLLFLQKSANRKGQADQVIEFIKSDSPLAENLNADYAIIKETEKPKYRPKHIVDLMKEEGFIEFNMHHHTNLYQSKEAKTPSKGFGVKISDQWFWYDVWITEVRKHCNDKIGKYGKSYQ